MNYKYKIFLDDIRMPKDIYPRCEDSEWVIIRNLTDFKNKIKKDGVPDYISFDNDLGESLEEGKDAAKWIVFEEWLDISNMEFIVHSANSSGVREYIESLLNNWKKNLEEENNMIDKEKKEEVVEVLIISQEINIVSFESIELEEPQEIRALHDIHIPSDITIIKDLLKDRGYKLFLVGGAVRDALLGKLPKDYDLATDALPDKVEEVMKAGGLRTIPTGKAFGIINVFTSEGEYEIATFRSDIYNEPEINKIISGGRRPDSVTYGSIENDAKRRDLRINALYYDLDTNEIIDLVGGMEDLKNGIVRTVGNPEDRFREDRLRIIRAIRMTARFGSEFDQSADAALQKDSSLDGISGERIRDEFIKGIQSAKSQKHYLELVLKYGLFDNIFKGLNVDTIFIQRLGGHNYKNYILLVAQLLKDNNIDVLRKTLNKLKYSSDEIKSITFLISMLDLDINTAVILKRAEKNSCLVAHEIREFCIDAGVYCQLMDAFDDFKLNVSSKELSDKGFLGKALGDEINRVETEKFSNLLISF